MIEFCRSPLLPAQDWFVQTLDEFRYPEQDIRSAERN